MFPRETVNSVNKQPTNHLVVYCCYIEISTLLLSNNSSYSPTNWQFRQQLRGQQQVAIHPWPNIQLFFTNKPTGCFWQGTWATPGSLDPRASILEIETVQGFLFGDVSEDHWWLMPTSSKSFGWWTFHISTGWSSAKRDYHNHHFMNSGGTDFSRRKDYPSTYPSDKALIQVMIIRLSWTWGLHQDYIFHIPHT